MVSQGKVTRILFKRWNHINFSNQSKRVMNANELSSLMGTLVIRPINHHFGRFHLKMSIHHIAYHILIIQKQKCSTYLEVIL